MVHCVNTFEELMQLREKLTSLAFFFFVSGDKVHQYHMALNRVWRKTNQTELRDRAKHLPMVWCPYQEGRLEMYYKVSETEIRKALEQ
jgi:hypothetical protein